MADVAEPGFQQVSLFSLQIRRPVASATAATGAATGTPVRTDLCRTKAP